MKYTVIVLVFASLLFAFSFAQPETEQPGCETVPGRDGRPGLDGLDGLDGLNGQPGQPGPPGMNGTNAPPVSICEYAQVYNMGETLALFNGFIVFLGSGWFSSGMSHSLNPVNDAPFIKVAKAGQYSISFTAHTLSTSPIAVLSIYVNGSPMSGSEYSAEIAVNTFSRLDATVDLSAGDTVAMHIDSGTLTLASGPGPTMNFLVISLKL